MTAHDFDWYRERLGEPTKQGRQTKGNRDASWPCPLGSGDPGSTSLHITERPNADALVKDFAHEHTKADVIEYLDGTTSVKIAPPKPSTQSTRAKAAPKIRSRDPRPAYSPTGAKVADQVGGAWKPPLKPRGISPSDLHGGLATLAAVPADAAVILVEGHGPAIALNAAGIPAVATVTGKAGTISEVGASVLYGRRVVLSPDVGGEDHMERNGSIIARVASEVLVAAEWPAWMKDGDDAAQFIEREKADATRAFYERALPWEPVEGEDDDYLAMYASEVTYNAKVKPLLLGMLDPDDYSILFGAGGVGKGVVAAWWVARLIRDEGFVVLLLDYEENTVMEWGPRVKRFGGDLSRLRIVQTEAAIWDAKDRIRADVQTLREDFPDAPIYMVVDSVTYAIGDAKVESSDTATKYKKALNAIGVPRTLSLAHVTKENADPRYPFGSVFWHNNVRHTIGMSRKDDADDAPRVLKNRKANRRGEFAPVEIPWAWVRSELPDTLEERASRVRTYDRIRDALGDAEKTVREIVAELDLDGGESVKESAVKAALERGAEFDNDGKKPARWHAIELAKPSKSVAIGGAG